MKWGILDFKLLFFWIDSLDDSLVGSARREGKGKKERRKEGEIRNVELDILAGKNTI